jgi:uncharacterized protein (TIGR03435 family)
MRVPALLCLFLVVATTLTFGQKAPEFDAVSVKIRKAESVDPLRPETMLAVIPVMRGGPGTSSPGRIRYMNVTLVGLIVKAYSLGGADQVEGPGWLTGERYSIDAILPPDTTAEQFSRMLQNLLTSRFGLDFEWTDREFRVYRLVVAEGGPKLRKSAAGAEDDDSGRALASQVMNRKAPLDGEGCPTLPPDRHAALGRNGCMTYVGWSMDEFTRLSLGLYVANETGGSRSWAHVIDGTGLDGRFDFTLRYDAGYHMMMNAPGMGSMRDQLTSSNPVSIFKAIEPLGLKLVKDQAVLKVMIVKRVEKIPVEN